ncbi:MAG: deoxyhypusine synthase family protein, partial [Myxococcota bacterium]|nr:deoxyhypusine synthase family protein [Myxococcota bacterium]
ARAVDAFQAHHREFRDGREDGLTPLQTLDLQAVGDVDELLRAMGRTAFGGRRMGDAADTLEAMVRDPGCSVVLTLSGAMTVAKMGLVITEMIERGWVQAVVSTGALMTHGLVELTGMEHYKADPDVDDRELFHKGYNRVYDTYEMEQNLNDLQRHMVQTFDTMPTDRRWGSWELCRRIGEDLDRPGIRGIMVSAARRNVPIYIPAFTDSELGLDLATWLVSRLKAAEGGSAKDKLLDLRSPFDPFLDLGHYASLVSRSPRMGIFTIGGGVPRNWAQQAPPFIDVLNTALDEDVVLNRFRYGLRICPEPPHWGGLSGCTYSEGVSWGKFVPPAEGGMYAEVFSDATIAWPFIVKAVAERLDKAGFVPGNPIDGR